VLRKAGASGSVVRAAAVHNPTVAGPIPATVTPGDPAHDYPFLSTQYDLGRDGFTEQEFFFSGTASRYNVANGQLTTATLIDTGHPYKTRMVVRRPVKAKDFNGTVLVEWYNVTVGFDVEANWFRYHEEIVREGYAWVGISAQRVGVNFLKTWSPARYGSLDVSQGGTINNDALNWDIYSQALQAIRSPQGISPLADLKVQRVIADGESSSASKLTQYFNAIHPLAGLADAFILNGAPEPNIVVRTDLATPVFILTTETDVAVIGHAQNRQADSDTLRTWEVAGTSHADRDGRQSRAVPGHRHIPRPDLRLPGADPDAIQVRLPRSHRARGPLDAGRHPAASGDAAGSRLGGAGATRRGACPRQLRHRQGRDPSLRRRRPDRDQCQPERPRVLLLDLGPVPTVRRSHAAQPVPDAREVRVQGRAGERPERKGRIPAPTGRPNDQARRNPFEHRRLGRSGRQAVLTARESIAARPPAVVICHARRAR
jgi:hypothetical protein